MANNRRELKYLLNNALLFAISSFSTKIMAYIILPLYTETVTESEYGVIDLINVTINLLVPLLSLCITDYLLRYGTENKDNIHKAFSLSVFISLAGVVLLAVLFPIYGGFDSFQGYAYFLVIGYFIVIINQVISFMLRAIDKVKYVALMGLISTVVTISLTMVYRFNDVLSIKSYFICQYTGTMFSVAFAIIFGKLYKYICIPHYTKNEIHEISRFCLPLIPNSLFWWVNSSIDKYCIIALVGLSASGLYGAASKIPSLLTVFSSIFQQAWNLSLFQKKKDNSSFENKVFVYYQYLLILGTSLIVLGSKFISRILLRGEFFDSWILVPILVVSFLYSTMSTFIGSFFTARKNTAPLFKTSMCSAMINVVLNIILIWSIGLKGAAIATMLSSLTNYALRVRLVIKNKYIDKISVRKMAFMYVPITVISIAFCFVKSEWVLFATTVLVILSVVFMIIVEYRGEKKHEIS